MFNKILKLKRFEYLPNALPNLDDNIVKEFTFSEIYTNKFQISSEIIEKNYDKLKLEDFVSSRQKFNIDSNFLNTKVSFFKKLLCDKIEGLFDNNVSRKGITIYIIKDELSIISITNSLPLVIVELINDNSSNDPEKRTFYYGILK